MSDLKDLKKKNWNPHSRQSKFPRKNHYVKYYVFPQTLKFKKNQKNEVLADEKVNKEQVDNHDLCDKLRDTGKNKNKNGVDLYQNQLFILYYYYSFQQNAN